MDRTRKQMIADARRFYADGGHDKTSALQVLGYLEAADGEIDAMNRQLIEVHYGPDPLPVLTFFICAAILIRSFL